MKKVSMYGAVASVFLLAAAPAALAQNYNPNYGQDTNQSQNWNRSGSDWNRSGSDWNRSAADWNQGGQGWNRGGVQSGWNQGSDQGWNQGRYGAGNQGRYNGSWTQGSGGSQQGFQGSSGQGSNGPSAQEAYQELGKFGYRNIQGMERSKGWEARATRNGDRVHVFIDDDGSIATYRGP
jgi:hypothetical protein